MSSAVTQSTASAQAVVEAGGIEYRAIRLVPRILERFRGQVSPKTPSNGTSKTRYRTF